ncbi:hypothetical protein JAAARDRAFT_61170 [Jaapia argillacea MUCL 33604]|uniref:DNA 3'-5' helicase n=1 Tax=Jaapia argillacea MUCL 33604 TaxID=933084 RepID=A0A067PFY3_9AGAM|nr:hypothetical protein JAAARDRAFT_61170 [Jaapia argillacea MUCL 33604]
MEGLEDRIETAFGYKLKDFQACAVKEQLCRKDVLVHAGTGSSTTTIAAGPHLHPESKGKVTLIVSPLIALHDEQVDIYQTEFKLTATTVNSSHGRCNRETLDVPNILIVIRAIQHLMNSFVDLQFVIGAGVMSPSQIKKTFVYANSIDMGIHIVDHLKEFLPPELRNTGLICPYNAAQGKVYCTRAMEGFKRGDIRVLVCTDATRMGCNILDIDMVVQWKIPSSVSSFVQRAGRTARVNSCEGLAVLLVEPFTYDVDLTSRLHCKAVVKKGEKSYTQMHGVKRGSTGGKHDEVLVRETPKLDPMAKDEGLYVLIQTGVCCRQVLTEIFKNKNSSKYTIPNYKDAIFASTAILTNEVCELLASVGPIPTLEVLSHLLEGRWGWYRKYRGELHMMLAGLSILSMVPLPKKTRVAKKTTKPAMEPSEECNTAPSKQSQSIMAEPVIAAPGTVESPPVSK